MIGYLSGSVQAIGDKYVILDVHGVGYRVTVSEKMKLIIANIGAEVKIFTHFLMNPRDGSVELYGFQNADELSFFNLLTSISGIGPKSAQAILANTDLVTLQMAILNGDSTTLSKVGGVGAKTAQRLILELKNKIGLLPLSTEASASLHKDAEVIDALVTLGYTHFQAHDALKAIGEIDTVEDRVAAALRILAKK